MNKKPVWVLTGLAVAAVAVVAGLTKDRWMASGPQSVASLEMSRAPEPAPQTAVTPEPPPQQAAAKEAEKPEVPVASAPEVQSEAPLAETAPAEMPLEPAAPATAQPETAEAPQQPAAEAPEVQPEQQASAAPSAEPVAEPDQPVTAAAPAAAPDQPEQVPAFDTVRVERTGEAVIAGTAEAGAEVVVKLDGKEIGKAVANESGAFVVVPDNPLPEGSGALTIEAKGEGDSEATASEQVVAVIVPAQITKQEALVAVVSPGEPTRVLQSPAAEVEPEAAPPATEEKVAAALPEPEVSAAPKPATSKPRMVSLDAVDYDEGGNIVFSGRGEPGLGARVYVDNTHVGDADVGGNGRWQFSGTANIAPGVHSLRVDGVDANGKVMNRIEVPFFREEGRKVAAAASPVDPPAAELEITEGKQDVVASAVPASDAAAPPPKDGRVVIQPGNNLWRMSKVLYGTGTKFTVIYEANKDQIRDPDRIYPGQVFMTPDVVPPAETIDPKLREPLVPAADAAAQ